METQQPSFLKGVSIQFTAILLAAAGAVLISLAQTLTNGAISCEIPTADPAQAGLLGALIKGAHSAVIASRGTMG